MGPHQAGLLVARVLAILVILSLLRVITAMPMVVDAIGVSEQGSAMLRTMRIVSGIQVAGHIFLAWWLWFRAGDFASRIAQAEPATTDPTELPYAYAVIILGALGLFFVIGVLPALTVDIFSFLYVRDEDRTQKYALHYLPAIVQLILGLLLLFFRRQAADWMLQVKR